MKRYLIITLLCVGLTLLLSLTAKSQNEAFHGGKGDGFGMATSDVLSFEDVSFVGNPLTVTVEQADGQLDPANVFPVLFTVTFSENVDDFTADDVIVNGSAAAKTVNVTGSGNVYTVEISNIAQNGDIIISVPAGITKNSVGNPNEASSSVDNSVTVFGFDIAAEISLAADQKLITNSLEVNYLVKFSEAISGFTNEDVIISGTANATDLSITGSGKNYNLVVSNPKKDGTVTVSIPAGAVSGSSGLSNMSSSGDNIEVVIDRTKPSLDINLAPEQAIVSNNDTIEFVAIFSEKVNGFTADDIILTTSTGARIISVSETDSVFIITLAGMTKDGQIQINIPSDVCSDLAGNTNLASNNLGNSVSFDRAGPSVEIIQAEGQADPALTLPLRFSIMFSEEIKGFSDKKINFGASENVYLELTGVGLLYEVKLFGVKNNETVSINVPAGVVQDYVGNYNTPSKNTDNTITYIGTTGLSDLNGGDECEIYYYDRNIYINLGAKPTDFSIVNIYGVNGQKLYSSSLIDQRNIIPFDMKRGIVIIQVIHNNRIYKNVVINN